MARTTMESWIREEQGSDVITRANETSVAESALRSVPMSTETKTEPRLGGSTVGVVPKGSAYPEVNGTHDEVILRAYKFGSVERIAEEDIDDNLVNVIEAKKVAWATSFAITFDNAVFGTSAAQNGTTVPFTSIYRALTTADASVGYTANANVLTTAGELTYDKLNQLISLGEGNGFFGAGSLVVAHPAVRGLIRGIKDDNGSPIFTPSARQGDPDTIFGVPVRWSLGAVVSATAGEQAVVPGGGAKGAAGNPLLVYVNPQLAMVGKRSGPESFVIPGDTGVSSLTDETLLKMRARRAFVLGHPKGAAILEVTNA